MSSTGTSKNTNAVSAKTCTFVRQEEECDKGLPLFVFEALFLSPAVGCHPKEPQSTAMDSSAAALGGCLSAMQKKIKVWIKEWRQKRFSLESTGAARGMSVV